jgi:hypothetical protein
VVRITFRRGANIPALNDLLRPLGAALGDRIFDGVLHLGEKVHQKKKKKKNNQQPKGTAYLSRLSRTPQFEASIMSGTAIAEFPADGILIYETLQDQTEDLLHRRSTTETVPILGLYSSSSFSLLQFVFLFSDLLRVLLWPPASF